MRFSALMAVLALTGVAVTEADSQLALLSGTLKTIQKASCDGQLLEIDCPANTSISIQFAQYGRHSVSPDTGGGPILCPPGRASSTPTLSPDVMVKYNVTCFARKALQTVVDKCQKEKSCQVYTTTTSFGEDPCPDVRKYLEVAYKCGPSIFQNKVLCKDERMTLSCPANFRLVIYSAEFGRTIAGDLRCPQTRGVPREDCRASFATESVMQNCHGRRRCLLSADVGTFGSPCNPKSHVYLKVIYTCVPREVLKEPFQHRLEADEDGYSGTDETGFKSSVIDPSNQSNKTAETSYDVDEVKGSVTDWKATSKSSTSPENEDTGKYRSTTNEVYDRSRMPQDAVPPPFLAAAGHSKVVHSPPSGDAKRKMVASVTERDSEAGSQATQIVSDWIQTFQYLRENHETLVLFLSLSVAGGVLLFCIVLAARLAVSRASSANSRRRGDDSLTLEQAHSSGNHSSSKPLSPTKRIATLCASTGSTASSGVATTALCPPPPFADSETDEEAAVAYPAMIGADSLEVVRYTQLIGTLRRQQNLMGGEAQPPRSFTAIHAAGGLDDSHLYS